MIDYDIINKYKEVTSSPNIISKNKLISNKILYKIRLDGNLVIQWMMTIYDLMGERRKSKINKIIEAWKNYTPKLRKRMQEGDKCKLGHLIIKFNIKTLPNGYKQCKICNTSMNRNRDFTFRQRLIERYKLEIGEV